MRKTNNRFPLLHMQQYFCNAPIEVGKDYEMTKEQAHHAVNVLHLNNETVRLVYNGIGYFGTLVPSGKKAVVHVEKQDERINEPAMEIILAIALIRREKFEWILQKATELGVSRIIPFESSRCVVHAKKEKADRQKERWNANAQSAAEQCKRNRIPKVDDIMSFSDLMKVEAQLKVCAYEKADIQSAYLSDLCHEQSSVLVLIGPEGGFSEGEIEMVKDHDFAPCTLGSRILRAETAALYSLSVLSELNEKRRNT